MSMFALVMVFPPRVLPRVLVPGRWSSGEVEAVGQAGGGEGGLDLVAAFLEVGPAVEVGGDDPAGAEQLRGLGTLSAVEGEQGAVEGEMHTGTAEEEDRGVHRGELLGDLLDVLQG